MVAQEIQESILICGETIQLQLLKLWPDEVVSDDVLEAYRVMPTKRVSK
jgi:hypothetical protein